MSDTTTTLNVGTSGDKMDESQVLQSDNVTQAKRPRVVIGGDAGYSGTANDLVQPVTTDPGKNPSSLPVLPQGIVNDTIEGGYVSGELRPLSMTTEGRLRVSAAEPRYGVRFFSDESVVLWADHQSDSVQRSSPWGS